MLPKPKLSVAARRTELLIMNAMALNKLDGVDHTTSVRYNTNSVSITIWTPDTKKAYKVLRTLAAWYQLEPEQSYVGRTAKGSFIRLTFKNDYLEAYWTTLPLEEVKDELDEDVDDYDDPFVDESDEEDFDWDCSSCPSRFECGEYIPDYEK